MLGLVVVSIIVGILAMHALSLENDRTGEVLSASSTVSIVAEPANAVGAATPLEVAQECDSVTCAPSHSATAIACILALLLTLSFLALLNRSRWEEFIATLRRHVLSAAPTHPRASIVAGPSLIAMSVSRT